MRRLSSSFLFLTALVACTDPVGPRGLPCARGALAGGAAVASTIAGSACSTTVGGAELAYADYDVDLTDGERYVFTVRSTDAWKPLLELRDRATGERIASGWVTGTGEAGSTAELLYVAPQSGRFTLRISEGDAGAGAYTLRSQRCGGSSQEIFSAQAVSAESMIGATDCVVHDRWLDADSAHAHSYVVYVNRAETRRVTLEAIGANAAAFRGAVVVVGPFERNASGSSRAMASGGSSVSLDFTGPSDKGGTYMIVAAGNTFDQLGDYRLTVGPAQ